jgi:hypothetical protein
MAMAMAMAMAMVTATVMAERNPVNPTQIKFHKKFVYF